MPSTDKEVFVSRAKLRSTLKYKFWMQEKANPHDNADAYRGDLTHYCAKSSYFKEIRLISARHKATAINFYALNFDKNALSLSD